MIEIVREPNGPVTIKITEESIEDVREILSTLFKESSFAQTRLHALSSRFEDLEDSISQLIDVNSKLAEALMERGEEKGPHLPARGTKYYGKLWDLCSRHLDEAFTSDDVPANERHILSILKNEYDVLEVARKKGRRNFYRVKPEIARCLIKDQGHWFSISIDPDKQAEIGLLVDEEKEKGGLLADVTDGESGVVYEFFFPDAARGRTFEKQLLAPAQT